MTESNYSIFYMMITYDQNYQRSKLCKPIICLIYFFFSIYIPARVQGSIFSP